MTSGSGLGEGDEATMGLLSDVTVELDDESLFLFRRLLWLLLVAMTLLLPPPTDGCLRCEALVVVVTVVEQVVEVVVVTWCEFLELAAAAEDEEEWDSCLWDLDEDELWPDDLLGDDLDLLDDDEDETALLGDVLLLGDDVDETDGLLNVGCNMALPKAPFRPEICKRKIKELFKNTIYVTAQTQNLKYSWAVNMTQIGNETWKLQITHGNV